VHRNKKAHLISRVMRVGLSTRQECPFVLQWGAAQTDEKATSDSPIRGCWGALDGRIPPGLQLPTSLSLD
jgi:hypothetical protein